MTAAGRRPRFPGGVRAAVFAVSLVGLVAGARGISRRRRLIAPVGPDLRSPILYLPLSLRSDRVVRAIRSLPAPAGPIAAGVDVRSRNIPNPAGADVRVVTYERPDRGRPSAALVWIHGGGMVMGQPEQDHALCSRFASELDLFVVSVDYRLAPEHPCPAGLDDCYLTLKWLHEQCDYKGVDPARVAIGGGSAGGGLAAALAQLARDRGGPNVCFQLLEYPMLDDRTVLRSDHAGRGAFVWTPASNRYAWTAYLGRPPVPHEAPTYAAPARTTDLAGLPPAWVGVGDLDLFHDEDVDYAARLVAAGVTCELHIEPGTYHGADIVRPNAPSSRTFSDRMTAALAAGVQSSTA